MKKTLALILVVVMLLCMVPASVFADTAEEPDEASAVEFHHKVYEANQLEALFGRHESLSYSVSCPEELGSSMYAWETEDSVYQESGTGEARLDRDRVVYNMSSDAETGAVEVVCGVDVEQDYDPFCRFLPETEEEFFDPTHDHVTRIWTEGGVLHGVSQYDETLSRWYVENKLELAYTGQTIRTEISLDAETYELLKSVAIMVEDGKETEIWAINAEYDKPEPLACRMLRAVFERESENMMTVSFLVDPDTDHEFSRTLTVPANTEATVMFSDNPIAFFNDPDGETLSHWDRMSDFSLYVFTDPDEELSAKFQALYEEDTQED